MCPIESLGRCPECPGKYHVIHGDGPSPCKIMLLGQNPGKEEEARAVNDNIGRVFIGDSGRELNEHYLPIAGLSRDTDVCVTNTMRCHTENNRKPSSKEAASCAAHFLPHELAARRPEVLVTLGSTPSSLLPGFGGEHWMETNRGIPREVELYGHKLWAFPTYHPAAGMHSTNLITQLMQDFAALGDFLRGDRSMIPVDKYPQRTYLDLTGQPDVLWESLAVDIQHTGYIAADTETYPGGPWCITVSAAPGKGYLIRAHDTKSLKVIQHYFDNYLVILHNALFDLDVLEQMSLAVPKYVDTMFMAYYQCDLPRALKPLGYRLAGMSMTDYNDVVMPYSRGKVLEWLERAYDIAEKIPTTRIVKKEFVWPVNEGKRRDALMAKISALNPIEKPELFDKEIDVIVEDSEYEGSEVTVVEHKTYIRVKIEEPVESKLSKDILRIHTHTAKDVPQDGTPYNPWKVWGELDADFITPVTDAIGEMPLASIDLVPHDKAVIYGCLDADATGRIYPILLKLRDKYRNMVVERDRDK